MAFKNIKKTQGRDFNFFEKRTVTWTQFGAPDGYTTTDGYGPDMIITFPTQGLIFINETDATTIQYSFNGTTVHGELVGGATSPSRSLTFNNRVASLIWFRISNGASATVSVQAWGTR